MRPEPFIVCIRDWHPLSRIAAFRDAIARNMKRPYTLVCFSNKPGECDNVMFIDTSEMELPEQWPRLLLFEPGWRGLSKVIFFDLDLDIVGDITPLVSVPGEFHTTIDQSLMVIGGGMGGFVWTTFSARQEELMRRHSPQSCIMALYKRAPSLRAVMPGDFFTHGCVGIP